MAKGRHRAEDQPDHKSTSQRLQGDRNQASQSAHRPKTTPSDLPHRDGRKD